jgi:hypothetical protein
VVDQHALGADIEHLNDAIFVVGDNQSVAAGESMLLIWGSTCDSQVAAAELWHASGGNQLDGRLPRALAKTSAAAVILGAMPPRKLDGRSSSR